MRILAGCCFLALFSSLADAQEDPQESAGCHTYAGCWAQPTGAAAWFDAQTTFRSYAHLALSPLHLPAAPAPVQLPPRVDTPLALSSSFSLAGDPNLCERMWAWVGGMCARLCLSSCVQDWVGIGAVSEFVYPLLLDPRLCVRRTARGRMPVWRYLRRRGTLHWVRHHLSR